MKKSLFSFLMVISMLVTMSSYTVSASNVTFGEFKDITGNLSISTGLSSARDVALAGGGRYALILMSSPSGVVKFDLLTKTVVDYTTLNAKNVKAIVVDEDQDVYMVSSTSSKNPELPITNQTVYAYSLSNLSTLVNTITYETPTNPATVDDKGKAVGAKTSDLYNMALKSINGVKYLYLTHQGTGYHTGYSQLFFDDVICRVNVSNVNSPEFDSAFGDNGYVYLENLISDGDPAKLFDVGVLDNGNMIILRQSDNNNKVSVFLTDENGSLITSTFVKYAKYVEIIDNIAILSLTGGKSIEAISTNTLENVSDVLPSVFPTIDYAGATYDAKNDIFYIATDKNNSLLATGDYTEDDQPTDQPIPTGSGIQGYFPYAYFYGYEYGDAGCNDSIKREEASALLYRILKQQGLTNDFSAKTSSFGDISIGHWAFQSLEYMNHIRVFPSSDEIQPDLPVHRAEIAKMVTLALGYGAKNSSPLRFADTPSSHPNYVYLKAAVDNDIFIGDNSGYLYPDEYITRLEFVTVVNRLLGRNIENYNIENAGQVFPDVAVNLGNWAYVETTLATHGFSENKDENGKYSLYPPRKPDRSLIDYN